MDVSHRIFPEVSAEGSCHFIPKVSPLPKPLPLYLLLYGVYARPSMSFTDVNLKLSLPSFAVPSTSSVAPTEMTWFGPFATFDKGVIFGFGPERWFGSACCSAAFDTYL